MTYRQLANRICACAAAAPLLLGCCTPTGAAAATTPSGGVSAATGGTTPVLTLPTPTLLPAALVVGGAITVRTRPATYLGDVLDFRGTTQPADPGATVLIETLAAGATTWTPLTRATVDRHGAFLARWVTNVTGHLAVRAVIAGHTGSPQAQSATATETSGTGELAVYSPAVATYFGPGLYGSQTACGETMTPELVGVANRTLPCGTKVEINYAGRTLVVPVVDRGPYANGADWDLTAATATALGMTQTETIGTIVGGAPTPAAPAPAPAASASTATSKLTAAYEQTTGGVAGG